MLYKLFLTSTQEAVYLQEIIDRLDFQNEFITDFLGGFSVEAFNVLSFLGIITCSLLLAIFIISSISNRKD